MRDHSHHIQKERHQAMRDVLDCWQFTRATEEVAVEEALGRVAAEDVLSLHELPNALTSNMDGVAVRWADFEGGAPDTSAWERGVQWQFCNTGIGMPEGFDTAIRIEDVDVSDDNARLAINVQPERRGQSTTEPGANLQVGDVLVREGEELTPVKLAVLNMGGHTRVRVVKRPVVAFIPTGNELVDAGQPVPRGKNVESNAVMACAKFTLWGAEPLRFPIVPDDWDQIEAALSQAAAKADVVVINAGSSKGSDDFTCEILQQHGTILHHMLAQGPGRHCSAALWEGVPVIGVSGPPMGAELNLDWLVKPLVDRYLGRPGAYPPMVFARMEEAPNFWPKPVQVIRRAVVERDEDDQLVCRLLQPQERPTLRGLDEANAYVAFGRGVQPWEAGELHPVELRYPYSIPPAR